MTDPPDSPDKQSLEHDTSLEAQASNRAMGWFSLASCLGWAIILGVLFYLFFWR